MFLNKLDKTVKICLILIACSSCGKNNRGIDPNWKTSKYCDQTTLKIQGRSFDSKPPTGFETLDQNLVCPLALIVNDALTKAATKALSEAGITYWGDYGTILSMLRFSSFQPWDDDTDFGVIRRDILKNRSKFDRALKDNQLELYSRLGCLDGTSHCWVVLSNKEFTKVARKHFPDITDKEIEYYRSRTLFTKGGTLDFFPYEEHISEGKSYIRHEGEWHNDFTKRGGETLGFLKNKMFPLLKGKLNGAEVPYPANYKEFFKVYYNDGEAENDWVMWSHNYTARNRVRINVHPEVRKYMESYLHYVFGI